MGLHPNARSIGDKNPGAMTIHGSATLGRIPPLLQPAFGTVEPPPGVLGSQKPPRQPSCDRWFRHCSWFLDGKVDGNKRSQLAIQEVGVLKKWTLANSALPLRRASRAIVCVRNLSRNPWSMGGQLGR